MKIKVVWLCQFPLEELEEKIKFTQKPKSHPGSWILNLATEIARNENISLNILTLTPHIYSDESCVYKNINIFLIKSGIPYLNKGYPYFFRFDIFSGYIVEKRKLLNQIKVLNPDIIHIHGTESAYIRVLPMFKEKTIVSIQGVYSLFFEKSKKISDTLQKKFEKDVIKYAKNFGTRTHYDTNFVIGTNPKAKIIELNEAISYNFFNKNWTYNPESISIVFVGSVIERKGVHILISAFSLVYKRYPKARLIIIGEIDLNYFNKLKSIILKEGIKDKVKFKGKLSSLEIATELESSTVFVLPSFHENSPNSLAEAMAVGIPCVASNVGGISTMLDNGKNGLMFKSGDIHQLSKKLLSLLDNPSLMETISNNAKAWVKNRQYPPIVAEQTIETYKKIIYSNE